MPLKIYQRHEVEISSEEANPDDRRSPPGAIPHELGNNLSKDSSSGRDDETGSERSTAGVVKVFHGV